MSLRTLYLLLAIVGAIVPYVFFIQHFQQAGLNFQAFTAAVFANDASSGFAADLLIASLVFWVAMLQCQRRHGGPAPLLYILLNLGIGLSCALPAWLYARELHAARSS